MGPMVLLGRMLSFYPEIIASFVLAAAATPWAIRLRTPVTMVLSGLSIGAVLLVDVRGLMWALPFLGGAAAAAIIGAGSDESQVSPKRWIRRCKLILCLMIPVAVSYPLGEWAFPANTTSLETQLDLRPLFATHGATGAEFVGPFSTETAYRWGWSSIFELPGTLAFLIFITFG